MEAVQVKNNKNKDYTIDDALHVLFSKLDDAIDDYENGRIVSEDEMWAELDKI